MAFKQVKTRASLFRPWACKGDSHALRPQVSPSTQKQSDGDNQPDGRCLDNQSDGRCLDNQSDSKLLNAPSQSSLNPVLPSAFRSPLMTSRTVQPLPVADPLSYGIGMPQNRIQDMIHQLPILDGISIPAEMPGSTNGLAACWTIAPEEMPFPVTPAFSQLLEQPNMSKFRVKKQRPKRFRCKQCQTSFSNNGQLKGHLRIHSGERPFACDHPSCGKQFTRNEELTRHKRIHTGVRPHPCILCGKRFGRKDHLKKHVKTHQRTNVVRMPISAFQGLSYFVGDCIPWY